MPPKSEQESELAPTKSRPKRKPRPKFEVPAEVGSTPVAGWAYREEPAPQAQSAPANAPAAQPAALNVPPGMDVLLTAGVEAFAFGLGTMTRMFVATASLLSAPVEITRRVLRP